MCFFFMFFLAKAEQHTLHCAKRHRIGMWFCKNAQNKMEAGGKKQKSTMVFDFVAEEQTILSNTGMSFFLSIGIAVASVLAFSRNLVIGFYVLLTIVLAAWLPWKLNSCDNLNCFPRPGF